MSITKLLIAVENARQAAISCRLDDDAMISSILQDADVTHELVVAAQARAHVLWLASYIRDQNATYDAAATERTARENVLVVITDYLRESWDRVQITRGGGGHGPALHRSSAGNTASIVMAMTEVISARKRTKASEARPSARSAGLGRVMGRIRDRFPAL